MLNEENEFKAYVTDPRSSEPRLQPKCLTDKFKNEGVLLGIDQVMVIVTRGFLFSYTALRMKVIVDKDQITSEGVEAAKELLNRWCGFKDAQNLKETLTVKEWFKEYPDADGWLREFWKYNYKKNADASDMDAEKWDKKASEKWEKNAEKWSEDYNSALDYTAKTITFDNVIAAALEKGPLKKRYIAVKKKEDAGRINNIEDMCDYVLNCKGGSTKKKIRMLKNIIAFRIWQSEHPGLQEEVLNQKLRLLNWYGLDDTKGEKTTWCFSDFKWKEKSIMHSIDITWNDFSKFGIDTDYLNHFGFELINPNETENEKYKNGFFIIKEKENSIKSDLEILNI